MMSTFYVNYLNISLPVRMFVTVGSAQLYCGISKREQRLVVRNGMAVHCLSVHYNQGDGH